MCQGRKVKDDCSKATIIHAAVGTTMARTAEGTLEKRLRTDEAQARPTISTKIMRLKDMWCGNMARALAYSELRSETNKNMRTLLAAQGWFHSRAPMERKCFCSIATSASAELCSTVMTSEARLLDGISSSGKSAAI